MASRNDKRATLRTKLDSRPDRISIPVKRIERLIKLATDYGLASLKIGHIEIVPAQNAQKAPGLDKRMEAFEKVYAEKMGKPLSERQRVDAELFGIDSIIEELQNGQ